MNRTLMIVICVVAAMCYVVGCGTEGSAPTDPQSGNGGGGGDVLDPNPNGVLLDGDPGSPAQQALDELPPSPVPEADINNGLLTTRLIAILAPGATVGSVNTALEAINARVVSMTSGSPFLSLKVPAVADAGAAQALASALRSSGAFIYAAPAHGVATDRITLAEPQRSMPPDNVSHLQYIRAYQAWNAKELAIANDDEIPVIVPDSYASSIPHGDISAQSIVGFGGINPLPGPDVYPGNNGFVVSGIIGADVDEDGATGINPAPGDLLDIQSMPTGGMTWADVFWNIAYRVATNGDRVVVNTGLAYNDPAFTTYSAFDRAMHVLAWRTVAALHYHKFIHITSASMELSNPVLSSPFIAAAAVDDVRELVNMNALSASDSMALESAWQDVVDNWPLATAITNNVIVAGDPSTPSSDVTASGFNILGPCVNEDPGASPGLLCDGEVAWYSGTAMSAAQVSGLAAYLLNLDPSLTPSGAKSLLLATASANQYNAVDAYDAVLALDNAPDGDVRKALLDLAGFESGDPDGKFDENDLVAWGVLENTLPIRQGRGGEEFDETRYDLNGDGGLGVDDTGRFDLDADGSFGSAVAMIEGANVTFNELAVTDLEILCYYAYSGLYTGDQTARTELFAPVHSGPFVEILSFTDIIQPGTPTPITIRAGVDTDGVVQYVEGMSVYIDVDNGDAAEDHGETGAGGVFTTDITLDDNRNEVFVTVEVNFGGESAEESTSAIRPNQIQILEREVELYSEVSFGYRPANQPAFQWIFNNWDVIEEGSEFFDSFDESSTNSGTATAAGMTGAGNLTASQVSNVWLSNGTDFGGFDFEGTITGMMSLTNPNLDVDAYQSQNAGASTMSVSFVVWGEGAQFNMHGQVTGTGYGYVELEGDQVIFECDDENPCGTISIGGNLAPGYYDIDLDYYDDAYFGKNCEGVYCDQSGSETQDGSMSATFEISPGLGPVGRSWTGRRVPGPRERQRPQLIKCPASSELSPSQVQRND